MEVDSVMHQIKKQLLSQESLHDIKMNFRRWNGTASSANMAGQKSGAWQVFALRGRKTSSKSNVYGRARLRMGSCWQAGGFSTIGTKREEEAGHGRAGMEAQRFQGMAAMAKCRWSFRIFSTSCARDHAACMLDYVRAAGDLTKD